MRSGLWVRVALVLAAVAGFGLPSLQSGASAPRALDEPAGLLLGSEPEPDAGPIPPGTPLQSLPSLYRNGTPSSSDPVRELQQLKRRAERVRGPLLGPLPSDAVRYRLLLDQLRGTAPGDPRGLSPSFPPAARPGGLRVATANRGVWTDVMASPVAWGKLPLAGGREVTLEARGMVGGTPLLYLIAEGRQVAFSGAEVETNGAGVKLTYTPEEEDEFQFLVRGPGDGVAGQCDLYVDGELQFPAVRFGGTAVPATWASGDEFQTAHLPAPAHRTVDTVLYAFDGLGQFVGRNDDGGVNGASRLVMSAASTETDAHLLVASDSQEPADGGQVRVYSNRLSQGDPDGDRLATPLETGLGTDPEAADTDGDGLRDDWEVLGLHTPSGDEDLPAYSDPWTPGAAASPTRMDLFVEMDWMGSETGDSHHYRLTDGAFAYVARALRERGGVWLHVDLGQMGAPGSRGGQSIPHQPRFHFTRTEPLSMQDLWSSPEYFGASRRHLFAYGLSIDRISPGLNTSGEMRRMYEDGQVIGTAEVWNPRYSPGFLICNGTGIYNHAWRQASILMHELGHCLRLRHGGNVDTNNKPNYISVMNYLFTLEALSPDGGLDYSHGGLAPLDESALDERAGLGFEPNDYLYRVVRGPRRGDVRSEQNRAAIDWNSSRTLDSAPVAADINGDRREAALSDFNDWREVKRPTRGFGWIGLNAGVEEWTSSNDLP
jgi:hypothetical protein